MGSSLSWLVVKHEEEELLLSSLEAYSDSSAGPLSFCLNRSTNGLLYLFEARGRHWTYGSYDNERCRLSLGREIWYCVYDERTMFSEFCFWKDGVEIWGVCHDLEAGGVFHLEERGVLPKEYFTLRDEKIREQKSHGGENAGIDEIISVPMELCKQLTFYDGGDDCPDGAHCLLYSPVIPPEPKIGFCAYAIMNILAMGSRLVGLFGKRNNTSSPAKDYPNNRINS
jgi:hypothetical protein